MDKHGPEDKTVSNNLDLFSLPPTFPLCLSVLLTLEYHLQSIVTFVVGYVLPSPVPPPPVAPITFKLKTLFDRAGHSTHVLDQVQNLLDKQCPTRAVQEKVSAPAAMAQCAKYGEVPLYEREWEGNWGAHGYTCDTVHLWLEVGEELSLFSGK